MSLRSLAIRVVETGGLIHQANLRALRSYLKTTSEEKLIREVKEIESGKLLRALWEAGLSSALQEAVLEQTKRISK